MSPLIIELPSRTKDLILSRKFHIKEKHIHWASVLPKIAINWPAKGALSFSLAPTRFLYAVRVGEQLMPLEQ